MSHKSILRLIRGKHCLKPLREGRNLTSDPTIVATALERLNYQAIGHMAISELGENVIKKREKESWKDPEQAKRLVLLALATHIAGKTSYAQFLFFASFPVENIFEQRWLAGEYKDVVEIVNTIDAFYSNEAGKRWTKKKSEEVTRLNKEHDELLDIKFIETLREFDLNEIADLKEADPVQFENLRERGRRTILEKDNTVEALRDVVAYYEEEAQKAASAKAYAAAIVALGSGLEGLLILRCLKAKKKAIVTANKLPKIKRPQANYATDPTRWTFDTLIETCMKAGWLPTISTQLADFNADKMANTLRLMRNNVHPGRVARERPWKEIDEQEYKDADAIYVALLSKVINKK